MASNAENVPNAASASIDRIPILFGHIMACFQCKHGQTSPLVLLGGIKKSIRYIALKYNTIINTTCEEG